MLSNMSQNIRFVEVMFQYELNSDVAVPTCHSTDSHFPYSIVRVISSLQTERELAIPRSGSAYKMGGITGVNSCSPSRK
jgi:hypothetical protein